MDGDYCPFTCVISKSRYPSLLEGQEIKDFRSRFCPRRIRIILLTAAIPFLQNDRLCSASNQFVVAKQPILSGRKHAHSLAQLIRLEVTMRSLARAGPGHLRSGIV